MSDGGAYGMTTTGYEIHVIRDRRWIVAERFPNDAREEAIATAKRMFNVDRLDGVRVFTEKFDNATQLFVPQYVMRDVRPGVKVARDAPVQAPAPPPTRRPAAAPRAVAAQASNPGWRPALNGPVAAITTPGGFSPDAYLQSVAMGTPPTNSPSAEETSALREAGRRAFETAVLIAGLLMEGVGFAMLLALLDGANSTWNERPLWVGLAFGLLLGGLLVVVRQINRLRALGSWLKPSNEILEVYPTPSPPGEKKDSGFRWRTLIDAVFYNKMPSKWPEPEPEPTPPPAEIAATQPKAVQEEAPEKPVEAPQPDEAESTPIDQLTGFIGKFLHGPGFQETVDALADDDSRFAAYLYLRGAADACVSAVGSAPRGPGLVLTAALAPLRLPSEKLSDYALRFQVFRNDPRCQMIVERGGEAMAAALQRRQADQTALADAISAWRMRPPLAANELVVVLAVEASLSIGGVPPEPSVVAHAFEDHKSMVAAVIEIYRGQPLGETGCTLFRSAPDAAAAAMEIQARRLELSLKEDAVPLDVRTVACEYPLLQLETASLGELVASVRRLAHLAVPGDVLVTESMRLALSSVGYKIRESRVVPTEVGEPTRLAAIDWSGAPQVSAAASA